ncbi:putative repeat protein (TIGR02543 family) [Cohnella sp. SGD-V74]|uniref:Ig-like domain-containing protein n=1 Tax=unclassified Cohnella TaxID=2636738 RepID=UPI000B8C0036|nr:MULTISPECIES: Ig-like domain-containing protein [unclassified Cohnella]PRX62977.1 putative repeat protein (TIGR02543 family) [Cohnella sp. SGD-V74]
MFLFGGVSAIGFQPSYAADRTVATWSELVTAFQTAPSGDTIILSADITQTSGTLRLQVGASLTLDLHGYKLNITAPPAQGAPGVGVYGNSSLTIEDGVGGGVLNTTGSPNGFGAGIGSDSNNKTAGTIIINSGTVIAVGSQAAAGIGGGGVEGSNGTVIINGGTVNAIGNNGAAGIGGGAFGNGGTVIITGGIVNATGNNGGAGIGGGYNGAGAAVTITGGTVTPSAGNTPSFSVIGGSPFGSLSNSGSGTIVLPSGQSLIIPSGVTFENSGTIEGGGRLRGEGTVHNTGTINSPVSGVAVNGNAYDLTFDLNGAPGTPPSSLHVLASTMQAAGKSLAIPAPSGYEFDGWYTSDGTLFTNTTPISSITSTGSATLYAKWKDFKIVSIVPISDIHVLYDTPLGAVVLPATVNVTLSNGETKTTAVTWNGGAPAYDGSQPGTYVFAGTLTVPEGSTNPDGITASVRVIVSDPKVTSVEALSDIHVSYGRLLSAIVFPATVNVTLSSGETKLASVTWNAGTPLYSRFVPGTYTFTGTLAAPAGFVNPDGITASVRVVVEDPTVTSVSMLSDTHVPYGTLLSAIGLPTTVNVTLSSGETKAASVAWDLGTPAYNGNQPGTYTFTGTLTAPAGSTNPGNLTASINVVVEDPTVTSVDALPDVHVPYGTELEDVGLPTTVDVTLSSGDKQEASIAWDGGTPAYNGNQPGTYAFIGTLTAPAGSTNPGNLTASINVVVEDPTVISVDALPDIHVPYGTEMEEVGLPPTVDVTLSSGDTEQATVSWNGGTPAYNGNQPGTYVFAGTLTAPAGSTNPNGITASINVVVEDPTVTSVDALLDIHVPYGTELEEVGLPPTVDVTLSSGETRTASVTWNGGTPTYNGNQPGTYAFIGTLTAPAGSTNPGGLTASVNVIVEDPTVISVDALLDIHVPYGTELEEVGLPPTVDVTLSSGETRTASVTWNGGTPAYNGNQPGTYVFAGTLTAPAGSTNPGGLTASVNVIVEDPTVISVDALLDIHVPYGTELEDVGLPPTVDVTLSSGDTEQATVSWNGGTPAYNGNQPGTYVFIGTLTAPAGSTNPGGLTASVNVIVEDPTVTSVDALPDIHVPYGTELEDVELPPTVDVTLSSGDTEQATVSWNGGTPAYNGTQPGTYTFTGTLTAPAGSTNPNSITASVNVIVEDPTVTSVDALSDIHVPYGTELEDVELPPTVDVTLSSGDTEQATVTWDGGVPSYNGNQPDTYVFTGTLTAPAGSTNPDNKTASVNVIVEDPTVISVDALSDIRVPYGTRLDNVKLPLTVEVTLSSGDKQEASITWDGGDPAYNGTKSGKYTFTGTLTPPAGAANPDNMTASVNVIVDSARSSETAPASGPLAPSTRIYCETGGCTISLGDQIEVSVPPKAVNLPFYLTLEMLETDEVQLPDEAQGLSQVFRLSRNVEDQPLQLPMTLLIRLESTKIGEGRRAALFAYDKSTGKWTEVNGSLAGEVFTAQTDEFADFAVLSVVKPVPPSQPQPEEPGILISDITGHWAEAEIKAAVAKGIVTGYQDGTFRPNQQVSRVEFTALLNRAFKLIGNEGASENPQSEFADAASIPTWARSSVAEATAQGLIRGFADGTFRPGELISRTEMAVIAARALHLSDALDTKLAFVDANDIPVWAREAVAAVQRAGLMNGKNGNRFDPRAPVTRAEAAGLIIRMIEHPR